MKCKTNITEHKSWVGLAAKITSAGSLDVGDDVWGAV